MKPESVSTKQERIAKLAAENPAMAFTSLNHYLDAEWLRYAYECTRKDGAVGVDGQTAQEYAADLEQNLQSLMDRLKSGRYRAPPVRRHYIDKSDDGKRALEEARERLKILQEPDASTNELLPMQEQVMKLSVALAEARAREGEQLTHLAALSKERETLRAERAGLMALLKSTQALLEQQNARVTVLERERTRALSVATKPSTRSRAGGNKAGRSRSRSKPPTRTSGTRNSGKPRKPK